MCPETTLKFPSTYHMWTAPEVCRQITFAASNPA